MHMQYDEEVDHGKDEPVIVVSPVKSKEIGMADNNNWFIFTMINFFVIACASEEPNLDILFLVAKGSTTFRL
ncbi:hypothetical protein TIFTF001_014030 [Ficus carica]|uniref:Uncharacterized protein n=1 Tax=Ficus carica TaxID=3494 RepID=A0AA88D7U0_FICCA|nr:hypothetical protein TIFTF001_014030 [Ficus carica]